MSTDLLYEHSLTLKANIMWARKNFKYHQYHLVSSISSVPGKDVRTCIATVCLFSQPRAILQTTEGVSEATAKVNKRLKDGTPRGRLKEVGRFNVIKKRR